MVPALLRPNAVRRRAFGSVPIRVSEQDQPAACRVEAPECGRLWIAEQRVGIDCDRPHMPLMPGCEIPIRSTADLTMWWAAPLPGDIPCPSLSMMWLDRRGRMQGRVLHITGMPDAPAVAALRPLLDFHDGIVAGEPEASGHLALLLSRDGDCAPSQCDDEWVELLELEPEDRIDELWSFHVAAG